jgi:hypothetical protein
MKNNYLKYWRVIRRWVFVKHGLSYADLEMLLFLASEGHFSKGDFDEYNEIFPWKKGRFEDLRKRGHIVKWRKEAHNQKALYALSRSTAGIIKSVYKKLDGSEIISENHNRMFKASATYTDKVHRNFIKKINQELRHQGPQQRQPPESP